MINICARQILFQKQCVVRLLDINHIHFRAITFYCSSFRLSFLILLNHIDDDLPLLHFFFFGLHVPRSLCNLLQVECPQWDCLVLKTLVRKPSTGLLCTVNGKCKAIIRLGCKDANTGDVSKLIFIDFGGWQCWIVTWHEAACSHAETNKRSWGVISVWILTWRLLERRRLPHRTAVTFNSIFFCISFNLFRAPQGEL